MYIYKKGCEQVHKEKLVIPTNYMIIMLEFSGANEWMQEWHVTYTDRAIQNNYFLVSKIYCEKKKIKLEVNRNPSQNNCWTLQWQLLLSFVHCANSIVSRVASVHEKSSVTVVRWESHKKNARCQQMWLQFLHLQSLIVSPKRVQVG